MCVKQAIPNRLCLLRGFRHLRSPAGGTRRSIAGGGDLGVPAFPASGAGGTQVGRAPHCGEALTVRERGDLASSRTAWGREGGPVVRLPQRHGDFRDDGAGLSGFPALVALLHRLWRERGVAVGRCAPAEVLGRRCVGVCLDRSPATAVRANAHQEVAVAVSAGRFFVSVAGGVQEGLTKPRPPGAGCTPGRALASIVVPRWRAPWARKGSFFLGAT